MQLQNFQNRRLLYFIECISKNEKGQKIAVMQGQKLSSNFNHEIYHRSVYLGTTFSVFNETIYLQKQNKKRKCITEAIISP